jgi:hypothetical protein
MRRNCALVVSLCIMLSCYGAALAQTGTDARVRYAFTGVRSVI